MTRLSDIGDYRLVAPEGYGIEPTVEDQELAFEKTVEDTERVGEWISGATTADFDERQSSAYWGPISTDDLIALLLGGKANAEQKVAICDEIQARFERDMRPLIQAKAKELAQRRIESEGVAQQERWAQERFEARFA